MQDRRSPSPAPWPTSARGVRVYPHALWALGILVTLLTAAPLRADDIPPHLMAQYEAARDYQNLLEEADAARDPARLDSQHAQDLLAAVTNRRDVLDQPYPPQDLGLLINACEYGKTLTTQLMNFNTPTLPDAGLADPEAAASLERQGIQNARRFQAQLTVLLPFQLHCGARMQPLLEEWWAVATPEELAGLGPAGTDTLRRNVQRQYLEILAVAAAQPARNELKQALMVALGESASAYARMLQPAQREEVAKTLGEALELADAAHHGSLQDAADAFQDTRCDALCQR